MTKDEKQTFVCRISQANRTELVVIMQDILICYLKDAKEAMIKQDEDMFVNQLQLARYAVKELRSSLDHRNTIAKDIYPIYNFVDKEIAKGIIARKMSNIDKIIDIVSELRKSFEKVSKEDHSEPLMANTQSIYAGLTYGKNQLSEDVWDSLDRKRGYLI